MTLLKLARKESHLQIDPWKARLINYFVVWQLKTKETTPMRNYRPNVRANFRERYSTEAVVQSCS